MAILLNGSTSITVDEATPGLELGKLSGGNGTYQLYHSEDTYTELFNTDPLNPQQILGDTLSLTSDWYFDFETKKLTKFIVTQQNGNISSYSTATRTLGNEGENPTIKIESGSEEATFTILISNKNEAISLEPTPFTQNRYGAVIGQVNSTDTHFSEVFFSGASFLEISGNNLKLKDEYHFSKDGLIVDINGSGFDTGQVNQFSNLKFIVPAGYTTHSSDQDGDGTPDLGFTTLLVENYLVDYFGSENVLTNPEVTITPENFIERNFGAIVAEINFSGQEPVSYSFNHSYLELSQGSKIKIKDDYYYDKTTGFVLDQDGNGYAIITSNALTITVKNTATDKNLVTETINISELNSTIFSNSNVNGEALITVVPIEFYDKELGAIIAKLEYSGSETASFILRSEGGGEHAFLELSGDKVKLKDTYYYDANMGHLTQKDFANTYKIADQGTTYNKLNILAKETSSEKNLAAELLTFQDFAPGVFSASNVLDKDESYTFVTDIKWVDHYENYPKTGREEYQKDIGTYWVLGENEKISYSFLEPGAAFFGNYQELNGIISPEDAFKTAGRQAFNIISSYADIDFEEITETGDVVGDLRIGIVNKDHFGLSLSYAAYSQAVSHRPTGGNIFFNGTVDQNNDGYCDYNQDLLMGLNSWNFATFMHEILHSLGLKHPFDVFDATDTEEGQANVMAKQYDQFTHTLMSYSPLRNPDPYNIEYDGITLNGYGSKQYYPSTPMLFDVMAIQEMYGANPTNSNVDNNYSYTPEAPPFEVIYDTGGNDVLDLSALTGGSELDLAGNTLSTVGKSVLIPFKTESDSGTTYGTAQGSPFSIITGSEIEKVLLPADTSNIKTGTYSTYIIGKSDSPLNATINTTEIGIKASGTANDTITLNQTSVNWGTDYIARHVGNNGNGEINQELNLGNYLKHDIHIDMSLGTDTILGTSGNDALFLQNFGTTGNTSYITDNGSITSSARITEFEIINLLDGDNLLDLTSTTNSLSGQNLQISTGEGDDILWLSDANENVNSGNGNDQIVLNGGNDIIETGFGADIITLTDYTGQATLKDFDPSSDKIIFSTKSEDIIVGINSITAKNTSGDYIVTFEESVDLSASANFATFI